MTIDESALRRRDFLPGSAIRLADNQYWTFPAPPSPLGPASGTPGEAADLGPDYYAAVDAVREAEDHVEQLRAELALAICLLVRNYVLGPDTLFALLDYPPGDPARLASQREFHRVALEHLHPSRSSAEALVPRVV